MLSSESSEKKEKKKKPTGDPVRVQTDDNGTSDSNARTFSP